MSHPIDLAGQRRQRARDRRSRVLRRVAIALGVVLVLAAVAFGLLNSPVLAVRRVAVEGNKVVAAEAIRQQANVQLGVPLARVDTGAIAGRVVALPGVGQADVHVTLPDTVTIAVTERPLAYVTNQNKAFQWVDPSGQMFNETPQRPAGAVLASVSDDQRVRASVGAAANALPDPLKKQVKLITASGPDDITLKLTTGGTIVWGSADQSELKAQAAQALLATRASVIDVSAPTHPTTRK
ncbi:cell division protein FtsQ/DivIB [Nigerium massiliense]|uniref:cell division protein FtsQ/DivIB n=1 Tax=Nigerium massiliense TaxID=1522317 RepID=UPI000694D40B|nr:FtsQ-type POTRA domain-containing protein [Nigerium massiliense]